MTQNNRSQTPRRQGRALPAFALLAVCTTAPALAQRPRPAQAPAARPPAQAAAAQAPAPAPAQPAAAPQQSGPTPLAIPVPPAGRLVAITNATIMTATHGTIPRGTIVIRDG
ncbi:MAG: hypothetical protein ABSB58_03900, partial [Gemmatimonadales bacterium]